MTHSDHPATDYEAVLGDDGLLRSTKASEFLTETGFSDVVNLAGGMLAFEV